MQAVNTQFAPFRWCPPSGVDPKSLADADKPYLDFKLPLDPQKITVIKASEMFK